MRPHTRPAKVARFLVAPRDIFCQNLPETAASGKTAELWGEASWVDEGPWSVGSCEPPIS
ncbi:hypothetical protein ACRRTK_018541 [Alexandromys fortis]